MAPNGTGIPSPAALPALVHPSQHDTGPYHAETSAGAEQALSAGEPNPIPHFPHTPRAALVPGNARPDATLEDTFGGIDAPLISPDGFYGAFWTSSSPQLFSERRLGDDEHSPSPLKHGCDGSAYLTPSRTDIAETPPASESPGTPYDLVAERGTSSSGTSTLVDLAAEGVLPKDIASVSNTPLLS